MKHEDTHTKIENAVGKAGLLADTVNRPVFTIVTTGIWAWRTFRVGEGIVFYGTRDVIHLEWKRTNRLGHDMQLWPRIKTDAV